MQITQAAIAQSFRSEELVCHRVAISHWQCAGPSLDCEQIATPLQGSRLDLTSAASTGHGAASALRRPLLVRPK